MFKFILSRIFSGIVDVVSVIILISSIIYLAPVDPARLTFGQRSDTSTVELKKKELGLNKGFGDQLFNYFFDLSPIVLTSQKENVYGVVKDINVTNSLYVYIKKPYFRTSYQSGRTVSSLLIDTVPITFILALSSFLIACILGLLLGIFASLKHNTFWDEFILGITTLGISVPSYVSAIVLTLIFAYILGPITGLNIQGSLVELNDLGDEIVVWKNLLLPTIALGVRPIAIITQLTRSTMLDVLSKDYMRTAEAKGVEYIDVIRKHGFKNALNPVVTSLTGWFASLLAGAFFVERVFNFKGIGDLTITALTNYDIPVLLACIIFICIVFIVLNILSDLINKYLDPKASFT